jgi:twitching motility protein PilJ
MNVIQEITSQTSAGTSATAQSIGNLADMALDLRESVAGFTLPEEASNDEGPADEGLGLGNELAAGIDDAAPTETHVPVLEEDEGLADLDLDADVDADLDEGLDLALEDEVELDLSDDDDLDGFDIDESLLNGDDDDDNRTATA